MDEAKQLRARFEGQALHLAALAVLVAGAVVVGSREGVLEEDFAGISTAAWYAASIVCAVAHQVYAWFGWRWKFYGRALTRGLGPRAFPVYAAGFFLLIFARIAALIFTALSGSGSVDIEPELRWTLCIAAGLPLPYLAWSAIRYLGWRRTAGIDHFDATYARAGLVRAGIFRWSPNALYVFGAPSLWIPGLALESSAALATAAFMHAYLWVHYRCTELPGSEGPLREPSSS